MDKLWKTLLPEVIQVVGKDDSDSGEAPTIFFDAELTGLGYTGKLVTVQIVKRLWVDNI